MITIFSNTAWPHADAVGKGPGNKVEIELEVDSCQTLFNTKERYRYERWPKISIAANGNVMK